MSKSKGSHATRRSSTLAALPTLGRRPVCQRAGPGSVDAFALGGVSAHAGLFSTARDLDRFWHWWDRMFAELDALEVRPTTLEAMLAAADGQV